MPERKPPDVATGDWVERQIRQAQERGDFDDLPGAGRPIPGLDRPQTALDWAVRWAEREGADLSAALPVSLALRREREDLSRSVVHQPSEARVRELVDAFNTRLRRAYLTPQAGPPLLLASLDAERAVQRWRDAQPAPELSPELAPVLGTPPRRRWWRPRRGPTPGTAAPTAAPARCTSGGDSGPPA